MTTSKPTSPAGSGPAQPKAAGTRKAERLATALRDNLKRRKAQERARRAAEAKPDADEA
jgi:hypothetical protein